ncbi:glycosyltransferase family 2 protein [Gillisia limnaea]|uniref:Glycosyl transferase family 2 n=1 Tax=Gillisia limnaea (strain DSM 15749 / LMG 21470 / R-8282) TaxID=865937 RepID=H2BV79_GILLR|nr:glycosyltransferase family A protein [Gillisia limnaea]EHQ01744.1 glycosyl transferase family 2 [Gillisia limnaea DSM 15749]
MTAKVTIIMATYNRAHFIIESLQSIQQQTFTDWECLIIDDGGTDNTLAVITHILENDNRFKYLKSPENHIKGLPGCRNYGLDLAKGDYIIFFDDDDIVHPQNLELCVLELSRNKMSFCRYLREVFFDDFHYNFDYSKNYTSFNIDANDLEKMLKNELPFNSCAVMWKKECFSNHRFVEHLMYAEEWELYSRILSDGFKGISIDKCLFYGRKHPNSNTGEFNSNDPVRRASNLMAIHLVIDNLFKKGLLTSNLVQYFIRLGFFLKEISVIEDVLKCSNAGTLKKVKYLWGYKIYPVLKPIFYMKAKLKKS